MQNELRSYFGRDDLRLFYRAEWGSSVFDHRRLIREAVRELTGEDHSDLEKLPVSAKYSISVSHSHTAGGFASVLQPLFIGFDIEETARIQAPVVARISSKEEIAAAPSAPALWSAKEAAFKALATLGNWQVLRDVSICDWMEAEFPSSTAAWSFRVLKSQTVHESGQGLVFSRDNLTFAVFIAEF